MCGGVKQTISTGLEMNVELHAEAQRLGCTVSRVVILAWKLARETVQAFQSRDGGAA